MRAVTFSEPGDPEVMAIEQVPSPVVEDGEVLIAVAYAGVNRPDVLQRQGHYPVPKGASPIMGLEVSGKVVRCGSQVTRFRPGDLVCALTNGGGYAEAVSVPEGQCLPLPQGVGLQEAAALPETCFTVWNNVFDRGRLQAGEWLLIHGGASGIGTTAIQMAKALDANVVVTASSGKKCQTCLALGADVAINYQQEDFVDRVRDVTEGRGADVILDMVGGDYIARNIKAAAVDGRIVNIAFLRGAKAEVNFGAVMMKRITLTGSTLRAQSDQAKAAIARQLEQVVWPMVAQKQLRPLIDTVFDWGQVEEAHRLMESNRVEGKLVLKVGDDDHEFE